MKKSVNIVLEILKDGNKRFINDKEKNYNFKQIRKRLIKKQDPFVIILSCSDSRVPPEIIFDVGLNSIFDIRIAGNIVNEDIIESIQYAINEFKCSTIVVLGHEGCGAIQMTQEGINNDITKKIKPIINSNKPIEANIQHSINEIKKNISNIEILGAKYILKTGEVKFL